MYEEIRELEKERLQRTKEVMEGKLCSQNLNVEAI